jgi:ribosome-binding factor A
MSSPRLQDIKRNQKEALIFRLISDLYLQACLENKELAGLIPTRASLSTDKSKCFILFYDPDGLEAFKKKLDILKLYKPSMRAALAAKMKSRYVPDIAFKFDEQFEKEKKVHEILDRVKKEDKF